MFFRSLEDWLVAKFFAMAIVCLVMGLAAIWSALPKKIQNFLDKWLTRALLVAWGIFGVWLIWKMFSFLLQPDQWR